MGTCCSAEMGINAHREIETQMLQQRKIDRELKKLLLLGAGSSGKSTLFRQLKCIHGWGFEEQDIQESRRAVRQNLVTGMIKLLKKSEDFYNSDPQCFKMCRIDLAFKPIFESVQSVISFSNKSFEFAEELDYEQMEILAKSIEFLWNLDAIKITYQHRSNKFSFPDNMEYFYDKVHEVMAEDFTPSHDDVLRTRVRTTGMVETTYEIKDSWISIYDVGGQRNERKKWIHCFHGVTAVLYVAALNHYKQVLFEDEDMNAMHESVELFSEICNSKWFRKTPIILFLNKNDLFREAISDGISLKCCFTRDVGWNGEQWNGPDYPLTVPAANGSSMATAATENNTLTDDVSINRSHNETEKVAIIDNNVDNTDSNEAAANDAPSATAGDTSTDNPTANSAVVNSNEKVCQNLVNPETDTQYFNTCYEEALKFISRQYVLMNQYHPPNKQKRVFPHVTTATDRHNIEKVFWDCQNIVVRGNLLKGGLV